MSGRGRHSPRETSAGGEKMQRQDVASLGAARGIAEMQDPAGTPPELALAPLPLPHPTPTPCVANLKQSNIEPQLRLRFRALNCRDFICQ